MKKWEIISKIKNQKSKIKTEEIIRILLNNRGIKTKKDIEEFLNPQPEKISSTVDINKTSLEKTLKRIKKAIDQKEKIIVFGDYDVDGICASAILWETLNSLKADVLPYIPHRIDEGYGLSIKGISNIQAQIQNVKLIITVDNGIVANKAVEFAKEQGIDVIITDHHIPSKNLPDAHSILHTTKVCGAGVAFLLAKEISNIKFQISNKLIKNEDRHLELVALATVADMVPLTGVNRILVKYGIERLRTTNRIGLKAIFEEAQIDQKTIGVYELGHIISPRINAMGRLEYAMDSLRLLCTKDKLRAKVLADKVGRTNKERQGVTEETVLHAKTQVLNLKGKSKLLFIQDKSYQAGVIGLVAGKLVEEFYRPAIVISEGEVYSKASARSVSGFNIIEFIRSGNDYLLDAGGHPMAAGFTVETTKIAVLKKFLEELAEKSLDEEKLIRKIKIDCELPLSIVNNNFYDEIQKLSPFGMGNFEPVFVTRSVQIEGIRLVGAGGKHLKLKVKSQKSKVKSEPQVVFDAIGFGLGEKSSQIKVGDKIDIVYTVSTDNWNGNNRIQLKIKDLRPVGSS